tara:strand:+ start:19172 stop:19435 length:264 start_codon:yes stop_codon:yes gene_type:complete
MTQDRTNAIFEVVGVLAALYNCHILIADHGVVQGVSVLSVAFFATWGAWNLYYYRYLGQSASQYAAGGLVAANGAWLALYLYYAAAA